MNEKIEVLLATYNGERFLEEQIESILAQTQPVSLLISDAGSQDGTVTIIEKYRQKYPNQIALLPQKGKLTVVENFSYLMESCSAPYLLFSDQDDFWDPCKVETLFALYQQHQQEGKPLLIHSDLEVVDQHLQTITPSFWGYTKIFPQKNSLNYLLTQNVVTGCTVFFNQALCKLASPIPSHAVMHDWWLALVAATFGELLHTEKCLIRYRQHDANTVGAVQFGTKEHWNRYHVLRDNLSEQKRFQAFCLRQRFDNRLSLEQKKLLDTYINLKHLSFFKNRKARMRYKFYRQGVLRNLYAFFFEKQP